MTNQTLIYHRPSKWPIATALGAAVLIHLSAVAIAFHREPAMTEPMASDSTIFPIEQGIGNPILDNSTLSAFRRWRFRPGSPLRVRIPITFLLTGAHY